MNGEVATKVSVPDYVKMYIVRSGKTRNEVYERQLRPYVTAEVSEA